MADSTPPPIVAPAHADEPDLSGNVFLREHLRALSSNMLKQNQVMRDLVDVLRDSRDESALVRAELRALREEISSLRAEVVALRSVTVT